MSEINPEQPVITEITESEIEVDAPGALDDDECPDEQVGEEVDYDLGEDEDDADA